MKPYERRSARDIYRNQWLGVEVHQIVHPNGVPGEHVLISSGRAVAVLVADEDDLLFALQPRFGAQTDVLEVVKGGADPGESMLECAQRELREELGLVAQKWESLGKLYELPSIIDNVVEVFLATDVYHVDADPEPQESIELVRISSSSAFAAAVAGKINDAVTLAALLRFGILRRLLKVAAAEP
ncbi:MAG: NUDIX hydrolase [Candidatus Eremiobacteraeota bacterium]|nr:NUDIX hydrolase [Candidatus Eremiobacteraeota bacterium]